MITEEQVATAGNKLQEVHDEIDVQPTEEQRKILYFYANIINRWERHQEHLARLETIEERIEMAAARGDNNFDYYRDRLHLNMLSQVEPPRVIYFQGWPDIMDFVNTFQFVIAGALVLLAFSPVFAEE